MKIIHSLFVFCGLFLCITALADALPTCHGQIANPINIPLSGFFPITIGSTTVESSGLPDTENPDNPVCVCGTFPDINVGAAMGYWEPMALIDVTRTPGCMVNMGGVQIAESKSEGTVDNEKDSSNSFYEVHYYNYPITKLLFSELIGGSCDTDGDFKIAYFSELDPTWHDESEAFIAFPETMVFQEPLAALAAQASCAIDSVAASLGLAKDDLFYCAGSQGFMYPMTGKVVSHESSVQATTLLAERTIYKLHRFGLIKDTSKDDLCEEQTNFIRPPKSRYRYQMIYPTLKSPEPFGRTTVLWESNVESPLQGDDTAYLIWRKRNCCSY